VLSDFPHPADRAQSWDDCDADVREYVTGTPAAVGIPLVGAYLHGSLAMGCFYRAKSDLDLLLVVEEPLNDRQRERASLALAMRSDRRPITGDLELSILTRRQARAHEHPRPYEVHYSAAWTERILLGRMHYADRHQADPDLAAHITVTRSRGVTLIGEPPQDVFAPVPESDYKAAVLADLAWALKDERLLESPYYGVLNACRVIAMLQSPPGTVLSKEEGALWALEELPGRHRPIVEQALACYRSARPVSLEERATDGHAWDADALRAFAAHALQHADRAK
jgi:streptomycin 3"-adenylyltransferase